MVLGTGIVSAVILAKKSPNYRTRLQKLQKKYDEHPPSTNVLYEIPVKQIFSIIMLIGFIYTLKYFEAEYTREIRASSIISEEKEVYQPLETGQSQIKVEFFDRHHLNINKNDFNSNNTSKIDTKISVQAKETLQRLNSMIHFLTFVKIVAIIGIVLWSETVFKRIIVFKTHIVIESYSVLGLRKLSKIYVNKHETREDTSRKFHEQNPQKIGKGKVLYQTEAKLQIFKQGKSKFTHTNYNYYVRLRNITRKNDGLASQSQETFNVIKKGDIFYARKALIMIAAVIGVKPDLKIRISKVGQKDIPRK